MPVHNVYPAGATHPTGQPLPNPVLLLKNAGLLLQVEIAPPDALAASLAAHEAVIPMSQAGAALIDTGASISCVHEPIAQTLGLQPVGTILLGSAAGAKIHNLYQVKTIFPGSPLPNLELTVVGVNLEGQGRVALIGMDLLYQCVLIYNGPQGSFTLAF